MAPTTHLLLALSTTFIHLSNAQESQRTPLMGYNTYNQVGCSPNATILTSAINALDSRGFLAAGYNYLSLDCGWAASDGQRNSTTNSLRVDTSRFPDGLEPLSALARGKGFKWSMYSDAGLRMCDTRVPSPVLGSLGYEREDAAYFASLETEFVKYDNCYINGTTENVNAPKDPRNDFVERFSVMRDALTEVGIPEMVVCQWGTPYIDEADGGILEGPAEWTEGIGSGFRLSDDIAQGWNNVYRIYNQAMHIAKSGLVGPGHFLDADLLEVGNPGMTTAEQTSHFVAWALLKSNLFISTDVSTLSSDLVALLQKQAIIAINQDRLGQPITLLQRWTSSHDLWYGPLANGDIVVLALDLSNTSRSLSIDFSALNISTATATNLVTSSVSQDISSYSTSVDAHDCIALRLSSITSLSPSPRPTPYISASSGTLSGSASLIPCDPSISASGSYVSHLGGSGNGSLSLVFPNSSSSYSKTQTLLVDFINTRVGYLWDEQGGSNEIIAGISVNGGEKQSVSFPLSGYDARRAGNVWRGYRVEVQGWNEGDNEIVIGGGGEGFSVVGVGVEE